MREPTIRDSFASRGNPSLTGATLLVTHGAGALLTRELFRLWRVVGLGETVDDETRLLLRQAEPGVSQFGDSL